MAPPLRIQNRIGDGEVNDERAESRRRRPGLLRRPIQTDSVSARGAAERAGAAYGFSTLTFVWKITFQSAFCFCQTEQAL